MVYTVYRCCIFCGIFNFAKFYHTAQIFESYKFCGFCYFPAKCKNYFCENERMPIVTWLNPCLQITKLIFHEIKILTNPQNYSPQNICAIRCICFKQHYVQKSNNLYGPHLIFDQFLNFNLLKSFYTCKIPSSQCQFPCPQPWECVS